MRHFIAAAIFLTTVSPAQAWGPIGHRITGAIADENLSETARANVRQLLGTEDLAQASTWADDMKSNPDAFWQQQAGSWHYITSEGDQYQTSDAPAGGDSVTALARFTATLRDPAAALDDKRTALRFIVHIVGDLHQPLHAGDGSDRGGNNFSVTWFGNSTNLHSVWDSGLIENRALSYSEYAKWLSRTITAEQISSWNQPDPAVWIEESIALRKTIYPANTNLSWDYAYQHREQLDDRLKRGGIRIAAYINWVFGGN